MSKNKYFLLDYCGDHQSLSINQDDKRNAVGGGKRRYVHVQVGQGHYLIRTLELWIIIHQIQAVLALRPRSTHFWHRVERRSQGRETNNQVYCPWARSK